MPDEPAVGIGHVVLTVRDVEASSRFYRDLGLQPFEEGGGLAILELRGGTHLILLPRKDGDQGGAPPERVDLMISGRTREELEAYRSAVVARGVEVPAIPDEALYGHYMLRLRDLDGNEVVVATSHSALTEASGSSGGAL